MLKPFSRLALAAALALTVLPAAAQRQKTVPPGDLSEPNLYEFLLGEIALQRGDAGLAAQTYVDLAKRTRDPRIARRAVEVANQARMPDLALEAAKLWQEIEPASAQALQVVAALLVTSKRVEEAEPYLVKLLAADGVNVENGFMQMNRLLAGNPDKAANLRVVRNLAAKYPELAPAHFAVAQAAALAGDDAAALESIRRAQKLRPEWETAAIFEAQLVQKRSPAEAAKVLGDFVEKYPTAREARINYARVLVLDKRFPEARKQFEALLAASPGNTEVIYAVGLLAFQLKDYPVAEENMKRLLGLKYRDPNGVRYVLGQIAEEQKQWPEAIKWYESVTDGDQVIPARVRTAGAMAKQGKVDEARAFLQRVGAEFPDERVQLTVAEAQLLRDANRHREAYDMLGQALQAGSRAARAAVRLRAHRREARALRRARGEPAQADPGAARPRARLQRARLLVRRAQHPPAGGEEADREGARARARGLLHHRQHGLGAVPPGRPQGRGASSCAAPMPAGPTPRSPPTSARCCGRMGQRDEADKVWQESLKSSPDNETLQKTIKRFKK